MGRRNWPVEKGRDGERTPMQWDGRAHAGFTTGRPWLPVHPDYRACNVEVERNDPDSVLNFYQRLLALRRRHRALLDGDWIPVNEDDSHVLTYLRRERDQAVLVVLNLSAQRRTVSLDLAPLGLATHVARTLVATCEAGPTVNLSAIDLPPYTVYLGDVSSPAQHLDSSPELAPHRNDS
jgi:alpha-glucosidase